MFFLCEFASTFNNMSFSKKYSFSENSYSSSSFKRNKTRTYTQYTCIRIAPIQSVARTLSNHRISYSNIPHAPIYLHIHPKTFSEYSILYIRSSHDIRYFLRRSSQFYVNNRRTQAYFPTIPQREPLC